MVLVRTETQQETKNFQSGDQRDAGLAMRLPHMDVIVLATTNRVDLYI